MILVSRPLTRLVIALITSATAAQAAEFELTLIDDEAIGYGTFQSHNQKVLQNGHGIFLTHIRTRNEAYTAQTWRLMHSADGGATFRVVHEATHATNPPVIESDSKDNLYLIRPDFTSGDAFLYRFSPEDDYSTHEITEIPRGAAGKYAMYLDEPRGLIYYFAHNNTFHTLNLVGTLLSTVDVVTAGDHAVLQYPQLNMDGDGRLHTAWTTQKHGVYMYWDIHHMLRDTPERPWRTMTGEALTLPVIVDNTGPAPRISLDDEFDAHTWLSSFTIKGHKIHFAYLAQTTPPREHYMRYDMTTGERDVHMYPRFGGEEFAVQSLGGFFATPDASAESPLFFVSQEQGYLTALRSDDNGATWHDHARYDEPFHIYSPGGARRTTPDGYIIGTFTDQDGSNAGTERSSSIYFFKVPIHSPE